MFAPEQDLAQQGLGQLNFKAIFALMLHRRNSK
jgi:hypothetical protein